VKLQYHNKLEKADDVYTKLPSIITEH
jgi:hypothetical protein